ncbi:MAG: hypothetical protein EPO42_05820 [Gallionellaceae bacterium]|nr:MAG: hypothetical protein EPO42_05820 [Gallionellaceae bacterium]
MKMKKRNLLRVPVTKGLKDIYAMDMHAAYQAACLGRFNVDAFGRLAAAVSVVRTALVRHETRIENAVELLDATIAVLQQVRHKGDTTGIWEITAAGRPAVLTGIEVAEQCIGTLDVALLAETAEQLLQEVGTGS